MVTKSTVVTLISSLTMMKPMVGASELSLAIIKPANHQLIKGMVRVARPAWDTQPPPVAADLGEEPAAEPDPQQDPVAESASEEDEAPSLEPAIEAAAALSKRQRQRLRQRSSNSSKALGSSKSTGKTPEVAAPAPATAATASSEPKQGRRLSNSKDRTVRSVSNATFFGLEMGVECVAFSSCVEDNCEGSDVWRSGASQVS